MIRGRLVGIRPVSDEDVPLIHRWMNHPDVWRYMDYERPFSLADVRDDVERSRAEGFPFTIVVAERPIGRIGINRFSRRDRRCGMYMFVGEPAYWGKGYARDAVLTLLTYAFDRGTFTRSNSGRSPTTTAPSVRTRRAGSWSKGPFASGRSRRGAGSTMRCSR
jgi:RimJ/RimL family protein N-acetyltransferase